MNVIFTLIAIAHSRVKENVTILSSPDINFAPFGVDAPARPS
jgi:hypothetical protein